MANIKIRLDAKEDLKQIEEYISRDSIYYANKTIEGIIDKIFINVSIYGKKNTRI